MQALTYKYLRRSLTSVLEDIPIQHTAKIAIEQLKVHRLTDRSTDGLASKNGAAYAQFYVNMLANTSALGCTFSDICGYMSYSAG